MVISIKGIDKIVVLGMGASGLSALKFLHFMGKDCYAVNQGDVSEWGESSETLKQLDDDHKVSQKDAKSVVEKAELIILSPGIPRDIELLKDCKIPIWSEIELAYQFLSSEEVLAITGTNGKTTTVSFLEQCLQHEGIEHFVGGNIGTPFCDYTYGKLSGERKRAKVVLLELSSFQLESMYNFRANCAAILNITFSHGERYDLLKDYAVAKRNIFDNQKKSDYAFYPKMLWQDLKLEPPKQGQVIEELALDEDHVKSYLEKIVDLNSLKIFGKHNHQNLFFAHKIWRSIFDNDDAFIKACTSFDGVNYRFQLISDKDGLKIFNDAKSTNWDATLTALNAIDSSEDIFLVLGGQLRGEGDNGVDLISSFKDQVKKVYLVGESGKFLLPIIDSQFNCEYVLDLNGLKKSVEKDNIKGTLVYSPAFPSFDQYKNYVERGKYFTELFNS